MGSEAFLAKLGIWYPIVQAPMGGGPTTPELVAAVSNAGGVGSLGAAYLSPQAILDAVAKIRQLTSRAFNVNLFAGGYEAREDFDARPMLDILSRIHEELGLAPPEIPSAKPSPYPDQIQAILEARPPIFSFTFGVPGAADLSRLRKKGILILGTATTVGEARALAGAGVDAVVAQGAEAGAHRGTFLGSFEAAMVPTLTLVSESSAAIPIPVIASGGIMTGGEIAQALRAGGCAAQLGTAFLVCPESGAPEAHKKAILTAQGDTPTVITTAFSGGPARGIPNQFTRLLDGRKNVILPYPRQNELTRAMRRAAARVHNTNYLSLWAGTGVQRTREMPAAQLVSTLANEIGI